MWQYGSPLGRLMRHALTSPAPSAPSAALYGEDRGFGEDWDHGAQNSPRSPNPPRYSAGRPPHDELAYRAPPASRPRPAIRRGITHLVDAVVAESQQDSDE